MYYRYVYEIFTYSIFYYGVQVVSCQNTNYWPIKDISSKNEHPHLAFRVYIFISVHGKTDFQAKLWNHSFR